MPAYEILLSSDRGFWTPQSKLYFSQSSRILVSRHPLEVVEEILYTYCPQCFSRFSEDDAIEAGNTCLSCKQCPQCDGIIQATGTELICSSCRLQLPSTSEKMIPPHQEPFDALLAQYQSLCKKKMPVSRHNEQDDSHWKMADLERKIADNEARIGSAFVDYLVEQRRTVLDQSSNVVLARGVRLRSKRTVRCRKDLEEGKLNILIQPKPYPLDGDSSMKLQTGDWWVKDSSAIHLLPLVTIVCCPSISDLDSDQWKYISLKFRNPKDSPAIIQFGGRTTTKQEDSYVVVNANGSISVESALHRANISSYFPNDADELTVNLEPYEDELLRGDDPSSASQNQASESRDNRYWSSVVDGHTAIINIPICTKEIATDEAVNKIEINVDYKLSVDDIELIVPMKIRLGL